MSFETVARLLLGRSRTASAAVQQVLGRGPVVEGGRIVERGNEKDSEDVVAA